MPRVRSLFPPTVVAVLTIGMLVSDGPTARGFDHRRRHTVVPANCVPTPVCQPVSQQVCVQYVMVPQYIYVNGPGGGGKQTANSDDPILYPVFVYDDEDRKVGREILKATIKVQDMVAGLPRERRAEPVVVKGQNLTAANVLDAVRKLRAEVRQQDTVMVYCCLHGISDDKGDAQVLLMHNKDDKLKKEERTLKRADLVEALEGTNARLKLLVTDSCYTISQAATAADFNSLFDRDEPAAGGGGAGGPPLAGIPLQDAKTQRYTMEDLFFNHQGLLNINSSKPGEEAFTPVFAPSFVEMAQGWERGDASWEVFFEELGKRVKTRFTHEYDKPGSPVSVRAKQIMQTTQTLTNLLADGGRSARTFPKPEKYSAKDQPKGVAAAGSGAGGTAPSMPAPPMTAETTTAPATMPAPSANPFEVPELTPPPVTGDRDMPPAVPTMPAPSAPNLAPPPDEQAAAAKLRIEGPANTRLVLDGSPMQPLPLPMIVQTLPVPAGKTATHTIRAELPGGPVEKTVTVRPGQEVTIDFNPAHAPATAAVPTPAPSPAELLVRVPKGAELTANGVATDKADGPRLIRTLPLEHGRTYSVTLQLTTAGEPVTRQLEVTAGKKVEVDLTPAPALASR